MWDKELRAAIAAGRKEFDLREYELKSLTDARSIDIFKNPNIVFAVTSDIRADKIVLHYIVGWKPTSNEQFKNARPVDSFILYINTKQLSTIISAKAAECHGLLYEWSTLEAIERHNTAFLFSCFGALNSAMGLLYLGQGGDAFFTSYSYKPTSPVLLAPMGLIMSTAYCFMGGQFNYKRMGAGMVSAGTAAMSTCLASHFIENPTARVVTSAVLLYIHTAISTRLLSSEHLADTPSASLGVV